MARLIRSAISDIDQHAVHNTAAGLFVRSQLFDRWCTDDKNSVLIPGYSVEGTLAKKLLSMPDEVQGMDGRVSHGTPCRTHTVVAE